MQSSSGSADKFDSSNLIVFLLRYRKPLIAISLLAAIVSSVVALLIQEKFLSTVVLFPAYTSSVSKSLMTEDVTGKKDIVQFGEEEQAEQMLQILNSDEIRSKIVEKYNLYKHYGIEDDDSFRETSLIKEWESNVSFKRTEFQSIRIDVLDKSPDTAALIANDISARLDSAKNKMQQERARDGLKIIEKEYFEMEAFMQSMDDSLTSIRKKGVIEYETQSEMLTMEYYKALSKGDASAIEKLNEEKAILAEYGSAYLSLTENLEFEREHLALLRAKYEETKVDAEENLTHKFVVNRAYPAEKKAYPIRWLIVVVSTFSAFILTILVIISVENYRRFIDYEKANTQSAE